MVPFLSHILAKLGILTDTVYANSLFSKRSVLEDASHSRCRLL